MTFKPTCEQLIEMCATNQEANADLVLSLLERLEELERRFNQNSRNSSKPPSSDGFNKKPTPKSTRGKTNKRSGGQPGHQAHWLKQQSAKEPSYVPMRSCSRI